MISTISGHTANAPLACQGMQPWRKAIHSPAGVAQGLISCSATKARPAPTSPFRWQNQKQQRRKYRHLGLSFFSAGAACACLRVRQHVSARRPFRASCAAATQEETSGRGEHKAQVPDQPVLQELPPPPESLANVKSIIAVSSCKGGVGKSSVAVNLAFELRKSGAKVAIFDCDVYGPSLPVMVKLAQKPKIQIYEDEDKQRHILPILHPESGIKLVSFGYLGGAAVMRGLMVSGLITQLLTQTDWGELDYLVLDMPPGTGDIHLTLTQTIQITAAVVVTTPQKLSTADVEKGITMFSKMGVPSIAVVQNMSYLPGPDGEKFYPFGETTAGEEIAAEYGIEHVFEIPMAAAVSEGGDSGVPFVVSGQQTAPGEVMASLANVVRAKVDEILKAKELETA